MTARELVLVDLTASGLHALGLTRTSLIGSRSRRYTWTNRVAEQLRRGAPYADGFVWVSRAMDTAQCVVLYEDPGRAPIIAEHPAEEAEALGLGPGLLFLRQLAVEARITLVVPSP